MSREGLQVRAAEWAGKYVLKPGLDLVRRRVGEFRIAVDGRDHLAQLAGKPYILVANHLRPEGSIAEQSQLSPDAFVLEQVVRETTGQTVRVVAKYGDGWWHTDPRKRARQKRMLPSLRALMEGAGFIPVNKNPGSFNRDFYGEAVQALTTQPILIFPEGNWYSEQESLTHPLSTGAAHIALRNANIPIVPVFIAGAHNWKRGQEVTIMFGQPFMPSELVKELSPQSSEKDKVATITSTIADRLVQLKERYHGSMAA